MVDICKANALLVDGHLPPCTLFKQKKPVKIVTSLIFSFNPFLTFYLMCHSCNWTKRVSARRDDNNFRALINIQKYFFFLARWDSG